MKNGLVLSGGAIKGAFEAGAICALLEDGFKPDSIFGISAGSLNGAFLADRAGRQLLAGQPLDWPAIGASLVEFWKTRVTKPEDILKTRWTGNVAADVLFNKFHGLTNTDRLKKLIDKELLHKNILAAKRKGVHFEAGAVDLFTGEIRYPNAANAPDLVDFVYASAAVPIGMPYVSIKYPPFGKPHPFVDGGIRDVAPLRRAIDDKCEDVICVVCQSEAVGGLDFNPGKLMQHIDRIMDIIINELVNNDLQVIKDFKRLIAQTKAGASIDKKLARYAAVPTPRIIRPNTPIDVDIMDFGPADIAKMIAQGIAAARAHPAKKQRKVVKRR